MREACTEVVHFFIIHIFCIFSVPMFRNLQKPDLVNICRVKFVKTF